MRRQQADDVLVERDPGPHRGRDFRGVGRRRLRARALARAPPASRACAGRRLMTFWSKGIRDRIAAAIFVVFAIGSAVGVTWTMRKGYAVYRLTRGVGDTWFLADNGHRGRRTDAHA